MNTSDEIRTKWNRPSLRIFDLPDSVLAGVSEFLPKPSVAFFAVALTAPSKSWHECGWQRQPSAASTAVVSYKSCHAGNDGDTQWEVFDFGDIEVSLSRKLSDYDVGATFACINAVKNTKKLKLSGCVNITGNGLVPLRGSVVLQQIDLSLAKEHASPDIESDALLSQEAVITILDSILYTPGSSLKQLQLPKKWRCEIMEENITPLNHFWERYNQYLNNVPFNCSGCIHPQEECSERYGHNLVGAVVMPCVQKFTCYKCLENYCDDSHGMTSWFCQACDKFYCQKCCPTDACSNMRCGTSVVQACDGCRKFVPCEGCHETFCDRCDLWHQCSLRL